jgi:hypothetical protein
MSDEHHADSMGHSLLLAFDTDCPQFARGFELGRLWQLLQDDGDEAVEQIIHADTAEMVLRMGEALDRLVQAEPLDDHWMRVLFLVADEEVEVGLSPQPDLD